MASQTREGAESIDILIGEIPERHNMIGSERGLCVPPPRYGCGRCQTSPPRADGLPAGESQ
jgi:hypothetical protein